MIPSNLTCYSSSVLRSFGRLDAGKTRISVRHSRMLMPTGQFSLI